MNGVVVDFAADSLAMEVQHVISLIEHHELKTPTVQLALMVACISAAASSSSKVQTSVGRLLNVFHNHGAGFFFSP